MNTQRQSQSAGTPEQDREDFLRLMVATQRLHPEVQTQADLARFLNVSPQEVTNWKRRGLPQDKLVVFAQIIGCRAEWLGTGDGDMIGSTLDRLFVELPENVKHSTLDYIQFQVASSAQCLIAGEKIATYNNWIQAIREDLAKRKGRL